MLNHVIMICKRRVHFSEMASLNPSNPHCCTSRARASDSLSDVEEEIKMTKTQEKRFSEFFKEDGDALKNFIYSYA